MKKVMLGLLVMLVFQVCTSELSEIDGMIGSHVDYVGGNGPGLEIPNDQFLGQYFAIEESNTLLFSRFEGRIKHDFNSPVREEILSKELGAKWTGYFEFAPGSYTFNVDSDKRIRISVDGDVLLNKHGKTKNEKAVKDLNGVHLVEVEYNLEDNVSNTKESIDTSGSTGGTADTGGSTEGTSDTGGSTDTDTGGSTGGTADTGGSTEGTSDTGGSTEATIDTGGSTEGTSDTGGSTEATIDTGGSTGGITTDSENEEVVATSSDTPTVVVEWEFSDKKNLEGTSMKIDWETSDYSAIVQPYSSASALFTLHGKTYFVYCDRDNRPVVGKMDESGRVTTTFLDNGADYTVYPDGHHVFSVGVDKDGYIHVTGDMHQHPYFSNPKIPQRYAGSDILYWVSDSPHDITSFSFKGFDAMRPEGWAFSYFEFISDNNNILYAKFRYRIQRSGGSHPGYYGYGLAKYNINTKSWTNLGVVPKPYDSYTPKHKVIIWLGARNYQPYQGGIFFDKLNRLHISASVNNTTTPAEDGNHIVYAYSDDGGITFKKANGKGIELPVGVNNGPHQGDLIETPTSTPDGLYAAYAAVGTDRNNMPLVDYSIYDRGGGLRGTYYKYWNGSAWSDRIRNMGGNNYYTLGSDGIITIANGASGGIKRKNNAADPGQNSNLNGRFMPIDRNAMRDHNILRGFLLRDGKLRIVSRKY